MVREKNNYLSGSANKELEADAYPMQKLLKAAQNNGNVLSLGQAIITTNLPPKQVQELLTDALRQGLARIDNEPASGQIRYHFDI